MTSEDFLIAIILGGIGISLAYLSAEYHLHRRLKAAERRSEFNLRELYAARAHTSV